MASYESARFDVLRPVTVLGRKTHPLCISDLEILAHLKNPYVQNRAPETLGQVLDFCAVVTTDAVDFLRLFLKGRNRHRNVFPLRRRLSFYTREGARRADFAIQDYWKRNWQTPRFREREDTGANGCLQLTLTLKTMLRKELGMSIEEAERYPISWAMWDLAALAQLNSGESPIQPEIGDGDADWLRSVTTAIQPEGIGDGR